MINFYIFISPIHTNLVLIFSLAFPSLSLSLSLFSSFHALKIGSKREYFWSKGSYFLKPAKQWSNSADSNQIFAWSESYPFRCWVLKEQKRVNSCNILHQDQEKSSRKFKAAKCSRPQYKSMRVIAVAGGKSQHVMWIYITMLATSYCLNLPKSSCILTSKTCVYII